MPKRKGSRNCLFVLVVGREHELRQKKGPSKWSEAQTNGPGTCEMFIHHYGWHRWRPKKSFEQSLMFFWFPFRERLPATRWTPLGKSATQTARIKQKTEPTSWIQTFYSPRERLTPLEVYKASLGPGAMRRDLEVDAAEQPGSRPFAFSPSGKK